MRSVWLVGYDDSVANDELLRRGITIPFLQRDLHVRSGTLDVRLQSPAATAPDPATPPR